MGFNEKVHAYIAAKYYLHLTETFGERGKAAFSHATRIYAEQRGSRMAQRAIRDGQPLTYETYCRYGEWVNTEEIAEMGAANQVMVASYNPDYEMHIYVCPWHSQFREMGMTEAGLAYCRDLDASICRGFNPQLQYETTQTLHDHDCCIQIVRSSGLTEVKRIEKNPANVRSFEYHCAHSFWTYHEITASVFGAEGEAVNALVLQDFRSDYCSEMADTLVRYRGTDFQVIQ